MFEMVVEHSLFTHQAKAVGLGSICGIMCLEFTQLCLHGILRIENQTTYFDLFQSIFTFFYYNQWVT